jgi:hypothetical protein
MTLKFHRSPEPVEGRFPGQLCLLRRGSPAVAFGSTGSGLRFYFNFNVTSLSPYKP